MPPTARNNPALAPFANGSINRLDSFFDRVLGDDAPLAHRAFSASATAPIAMWQDDDTIFVEAEVPGMTDGEIEVTVHDGALYIRGERKPEEGRKYLYNGRSYGRFERTISLPEPVNADGVQATL